MILNTVPARKEFTLVSTFVEYRISKVYKYDSCNVPIIPQFTMQFTVIASILIFFVAQTIATPSPQTDQLRCTSLSMVLRRGSKLIMVFSPIP